ncbi:MAG: eukaryotic-like serine/threonine-protein kinase [Actinomycetota bacterium]|jgi:serine/threonine-protein kinase|nr:eukaryotic-like serine/threonine-protein kinase [Actinomycetota bacterium]
MGDLPAARYQLIRVLGEGAMGVVWLAHDTVLDRAIAIKELRPGPGVDAAEAMDRFLVEARAAARLSHPNIVGIHDVLADGDRVLIAMELVEGPTLEEVIRTSGAQPPEVVRAIMAQVAQALAVAHGAGIIHRDLKPDNIFWTPEGRAVVTDFGLARIGTGRGTVEGTIMGTPGYMAPEQVRGTPTGPQSDVFAWGAVAYSLATGTGPFGEPSDTDSTALAYRIVHEEAPPLVLTDDSALANLITGCLAKEPEKRPSDGGALVGALALASLTGSPFPSTAVAGDPPAVSLAREARTTRSLWPIPAVLAVVLGLIAIVLVVSAPDRSPTNAVDGTTRETTTTEPTSQTTPTTTTVTVPLGLVPGGTALIAEGRYRPSVLRPEFTLDLDGQWRSLSGERTGLWELVRADRPTSNLLSFGYVDGVFNTESAPANRQEADASIEFPPDDLSGWLERHPRLAVSGVTNVQTRIGPAVRMDFTVESGYDHSQCPIACTLLFRAPESINILAFSGNMQRIYVWTYQGRHLFAMVEAPVSDFEGFLVAAEAVIASLSSP